MRGSGWRHALSANVNQAVVNAQSIATAPTCAATSATSCATPPLGCSSTTPSRPSATFFPNSPCAEKVNLRQVCAERCYDTQSPLSGLAPVRCNCASQLIRGVAVCALVPQRIVGFGRFICSADVAYAERLNYTFEMKTEKGLAPGGASPFVGSRFYAGVTLRGPCGR